MPPLYAHDPFLAIHRALQARWLDLPMAASSLAGLGAMVALLGGIVFALRERSWRGWAAVAVPFLAGLLVQGALVTLVKDLVRSPRPLAVYGAGLVRVGLEPLRGLGFPSGHSAGAALLAAYGCSVYGRSAAWLWGFAFLVGVSRVYVGAHWVTDVVGGWALGAILGLTAGAIGAKLPPAGHLSRRRSARTLDIGG
ncbi:MAG TPA: phosphatase PAP2 family protein [Anaeromyxobacteraceae bacterium]|jgi:undecaprenyl-diphosphatase|nr:phosphatase PAP2 family protein [Anaeromyxobacteraceae bacterium]